MSYDLSFGVASGKSPLALEEFQAHFRDRPCFSLGERQAWYENEDTGVYFSFEYDADLAPPEGRADEHREDAEEAPWVPSVASFNINFNRPSYFALEAAPEIEAFVRAFQLPVFDPQQNEDGDRPFDPDAFIKGWQNSNAWACRAMRSGPGSFDGPNYTYAGAGLHACWAWNLNRMHLQHEWGEGLFVPKISFAATCDGVKTLVVWPDAIPCLLPAVDLVICLCDDLAPRKLFRKRKKEISVASYENVARRLAGFPVRTGAIKYLELAYEAPPDEVIAIVKSQGTSPEAIDLKALQPDQVLDDELFTPASSV